MSGEVPNLALLSPRVVVDRATQRASVDPALTPGEMDRIAHRFLEALAKSAEWQPAGFTKGGGLEARAGGQAPHPKYVVSKLPNHFELLGLVAKLFPGAKVLG